MTDDQRPAARLEYLRQELRAERISYGELAELQSLRDHIEPGDVELLEPAGVPEWMTTEVAKDVQVKETLEKVQLILSTDLLTNDEKLTSIRETIA